jgi:hypothetical protein
MSDDSPRSENIQGFDDLLMFASVAAPLRGLNFLEFLYANSVPLYYGGGGDGYGYEEAGDSVASILARSLYDRRPVKQVITEEAQREIIDKKFTASMVEELKINDACGIWQEEFEDGEDIKILPCNHAFKSDAIIKWLREEKAECPICRFSLQSKEVIDDCDRDHYAVRPPYEADEHEREDQHADVQENESNGDNDIVRANNIASRLAQSVSGNVNPNFHREHHQQHNRAISVPMNQLIQSMRAMTSSSRSREHVRAAVPSTSGAAAPVSQSSHANAGREVRAEAMQHGGPRNNNNVAAAAAAAPAPAPPNIYINNNNYNYNYIRVDEYHQDIVSNQEQVDIEEAIRRSLV